MKEKKIIFVEIFYSRIYRHEINFLFIIFEGVFLMVKTKHRKRLSGINLTLPPVLFSKMYLLGRGLNLGLLLLMLS